MKTQNPYATNQGGKIEAIHKVALTTRSTKEKGEDLRTAKGVKGKEK